MGAWWSATCSDYEGAASGALPWRPQLFTLDQRLGGKLLGLPQELEELDLLQELQILGLAALKEEGQNLGAVEYQDHSIRFQAS